MPTFFKKLLSHRIATGAISTFLLCTVIAGVFIWFPPESSDAAASCLFYRVKWGDTVGQLAQAYHTTVAAIVNANHLINPNLIVVGQQLCIPVTHGTPPPNNGGGNKGGTGVVSGSVSDMIKQVFGPAYSAGALRVANCESGLNPNAYNPISVGGSHAAGVFQILYSSTWNSTSQARNSPYDAKANILAAHEIFVRDGNSWREWVCRP